MPIMIIEIIGKNIQNLRFISKSQNNTILFLSRLEFLSRSHLMIFITIDSFSLQLNFEFQNVFRIGPFQQRPVRIIIITLRNRLLFDLLII